MSNKTQIQFGNDEPIDLADLRKVPVSIRNGRGVVKLAPQDITTITKQYVNWDLFCRLACLDDSELEKVIESTMVEDDDGEYISSYGSGFMSFRSLCCHVKYHDDDPQGQLWKKLQAMEWPDEVLIEAPE